MFDSDRTTLLFDIFPGTDGRRYSANWEGKFPWLRYSNYKDAKFCINCLAFGSHTDRNGVFTGFRIKELEKCHMFKKRNIGITQRISKPPINLLAANLPN